MKITKTQLKQIIKEEISKVLSENDSNYHIEILGRHDDRDRLGQATARKKYDDYVLSRGEFEDGGLLDFSYGENQQIQDDFIEWMRLHPNTFEAELVTPDPLATVFDYARQQSLDRS